VDGPRPPRPDETDDLEDLAALCFGFPRPASRSRRRRAPRRSLGGRVIVADGRPIAHVHIVYNRLSIYGALVKIASFGGVCTHPDYRGRGLASQLLAYCLREVRDAGAALVLISGTRGLYRRTGAVPAGPVWHANVQAEALRRPRRSVSVRRAEHCDWPAIASLHHAEPVRFLRTGEFFSRLLPPDSHRDIWLAEMDGKPLAYLCLSHMWGIPDRDRVRALGEYAGARAAVLAALPLLLRAAELGGIRLSVPQFDQELTYLLRAQGHQLRAGTMPDHTIRLVNLPGLMKALRPYLRAHLSASELRRLECEQADDTFRFALSDHRAEMGVSEAGRLLFDGKRIPRISGDLHRALSLLTPIPIPLPGLNYV
jgi:predicted N-acetyltransferase YhbS